MQKFKYIPLVLIVLFLLIYSTLTPQEKISKVIQAPIWIMGDKQVNFTSNLPLVIIDTNNSYIKVKTPMVAKMSIIEPDENNQTKLDMPTSYNGYISIRVRGSSSLQFPKKQYSLKTITADGKNEDVSLIGMPKENKWILSAPYSDKTLMRNHLAYSKTREINEDKYYAVRSRFVEVLRYMEGKYNYEGVYVLMERIKRDKNRINIKKVKENKITGGYIMKLDKDVPKNIPLEYDENKMFYYVYPKPDKITNAQKLYISAYLRDFQKALYSDDFNLTSSKNYYGKWIDVDSFIVHFLSREYFFDSDLWQFSEYIHKDEHQKLFLSAVWDFNSGMGNDNYHFKGSRSALGYVQHFTGEPYTIASWIKRLMSDPIFYNKVKEKWSSLRNGIWSDKEMILSIYKIKDQLREPAKRNFKKWRKSIGHFVWPNRQTCKKPNGKRIYCRTFEDAVEYDLIYWLIRRGRWMDG